MKNLGELIKEARKSLELTQWEVADELNVARTTVSNWECGRAQPDLHALRKLSKVLRHDFFSDHSENAPVREQSSRKMRLKLTNDPLIEVVAPENSSIFAAGSIDFRVNGSDSHGNPVNFRIFANFRVENDAD